MKAIITIEEGDELGTVRLSLDFDPPLKEGEPLPLPAAVAFDLVNGGLDRAEEVLEHEGFDVD